MVGSGAIELERLRDEYAWSGLEGLEHRDGVLQAGGEAPDSAFGAPAIEDLSRVDEQSWWFNLRNRLILDMLMAADAPQAFWEVGSGTGVVAGAIASTGIPVVAVEPGLAGATEAGRRGITSVMATLEGLCLPDRSLPAIGLFDVIEHLADPGVLLRECHRVLEPEGLLFITVPAYRALWSVADEAAGHHRRYRPREVRKELRDTGFTVTHCGTRMASLVAPMFLARVLPQLLGRRRSATAVTAELTTVPSWVGRVLYAVERDLGRLAPFGASVFAAGRA